MRTNHRLFDVKKNKNQQRIVSCAFLIPTISLWQTEQTTKTKHCTSDSTVPLSLGGKRAVGELHGAESFACITQQKTKARLSKARCVSLSPRKNTPQPHPTAGERQAAGRNQKKSLRFGFGRDIHHTLDKHAPS